MDVKPFRARVGAVGPVLYKKGEGCGECYKVKCLDHRICSKRAVTVIITDECPGCPSDRTHFDLSGAAFGHMAVSGENGQLRNRGEIPVVYRRYTHFRWCLFTICVCVGVSVVVSFQEKSLFLLMGDICHLYDCDFLQNNMLIHWQKYCLSS